jgi:prevent-host-death family protein
MPAVLTVPDLIPISELRQRQKAILDSLKDEPVVLTQHGVAVAVLVDPHQWNARVNRLEDLDDAVVGLEARIALATGADQVTPWEAVRATLGGTPG